jgi:hypothetical protein
LPRFAIDKEDGTEPYLLAMADRFRLPIPAAKVKQVPLSVSPAPVGNAGLSALQVATLDALNQAMREQKISQQDCVALLAKYVGVSEPV